MIRSSSFELKTIFDKNLLIPTGAKVLDLNALIELNNTGVHIWKLLSINRTFEDLVLNISSHYGIETEKARQDVSAFLDAIDEIGLLE